MVDERCEAADAVEGLAAHGERGAEAVAHPALEQFRESSTLGWKSVAIPRASKRDANVRCAHGRGRAPSPIPTG
jgi:hypothetical protein